MHALIILIFFALIPISLSRFHSHPVGEHTHPRRLHQPWQRSDSDVHDLFRRASSVGPAIGSPEWKAKYPTNHIDVGKIPKEWTDALQKAIDAGKIPNVPQSHNVPMTNPVYPDGFNPTSPDVCSGTEQCRIPGDIWDGPDGYIGVGFDDGPSEGSGGLLQFLADNNRAATHFLIGNSIVTRPAQFQQIVNAPNQDLAVHTWTHPYMTTLSNQEILGQLGWTMAVISDSTGRLPRYWRPPYGDTDRRVSAIAKEVFGLQTILWNKDSQDWSIGQPKGATPDKITNMFQKWLAGPQSPGLVILEHESKPTTIKVFMDNYPLIKQSSWKTGSIAQLVSKDGPYQSNILNFGSVQPPKQNSVSNSNSVQTAATASPASTTTPKTTIATATTKAKNFAFRAVGQPFGNKIPVVIITLGLLVLF